MEIALEESLHAYEKSHKDELEKKEDEIKKICVISE